MAYDATNNQSSVAWPQLEFGPLLAGGILVGIGAVVALAGLTVVGSHVFAATRAWVNELETPPSQIARLKWEQAKTAAISGANTWRQHPNAKVRVLARGGNGGS
jgi:hypothetical protein